MNVSRLLTCHVCWIHIEYISLHNVEHPYPTKRQKSELALLSGLTQKQIVHWMSNIRKRRLLPLLSGKREPTSTVDIKFLGKYI